MPQAVMYYLANEIFILNFDALHHWWYEERYQKRGQLVGERDGVVSYWHKIPSTVNYTRISHALVKCKKLPDQACMIWRCRNSSRNSI
jgi:hypothetical protein